jgi:uncharacterized membrane protein YeaQ/YmgE (transglycosylase-associated protein family)
MRQDTGAWCDPGYNRCERPSENAALETKNREKGGAMGIISWILFGLVAGALAKWVMPGRDPGGVVVTMLIGIAGAFIGGYIATLLGFGNVTGFDIRSLIIAILGAVGLLFLYKKIAR